MRVAASHSIKQLPMAVFVLALCFCGAPLRAAVGAPQLVESKLQGGTILTAKADRLVSAVRDCVKENPDKAGNIVFAVLAGGRADADALASPVVVAAIGGLGEKPSKPAIASIVHFAVKATPAVVLEIVRAAVKASPKDAVQTIVAAAVQAVPNPRDKVNPSVTMLNTSGFSKDGKDTKDATPGNDEGMLPIGEAIALVAHQASGIALEDLTDTANRAAAEAVTSDLKSIYYGYYYPPVQSPLKSTAVTATVPDPSVVSK
jgi:hypothetical protein